MSGNNLFSTGRNYRAKDGKADYGVLFLKGAFGEWRAYKLGRPILGDFPDSFLPTLQLSGKSNSYFSTASRVRSLEEIERIIAHWTELTQQKKSWPGTV